MKRGQISSRCKFSVEPLFCIGGEQASLPPFSFHFRRPYQLVQTSAPTRPTSHNERGGAIAAGLDCLVSEPTTHPSTPRDSLAPKGNEVEAAEAASSNDVPTDLDDSSTLVLLPESSDGSPWLSTVLAQLRAVRQNYQAAHQAKEEDSARLLATIQQSDLSIASYGKEGKTRGLRIVGAEPSVNSGLPCSFGDSVSQTLALKIRIATGQDPFIASREVYCGLISQPDRPASSPRGLKNSFSSSSPRKSSL